MKAVFFDADGTTVDTEEEHRKFFIDIRYALQFQPDEEILADSSRFVPMTQFLRDQHFSDDEIKIAKRMFRDNFYRRYTPKLFPGAKDMISDLKKAGYLVGVVSSNHPHILSDYFGRLEKKLDYFSGHNGTQSKGERLAQGVQELGIHPLEAIMIGDMRHDVDAAQIAGTHFVGAGYGWELRADDPRYHVHPDIESLKEHLLWLKEY